jgi:hypothetical protein
MDWFACRAHIPLAPLGGIRPGDKYTPDAMQACAVRGLGGGSFLAIDSLPVRRRRRDGRM